jgi:hypothetical protein
MPVSYLWRGDFSSAEVNLLHAESFGTRLFGDEESDWRARVQRHSLGWVAARDGADLVGFVNVAWDGGVHAFVLDTMVSGSVRHSGIGTEMLDVARAQATSAGCQWLHVDFEDDLGPFYFEAGGFTPTAAGLIRLVTDGG